MHDPTNVTREARAKRSRCTKLGSAGISSRKGAWRYQIGIRNGIVHQMSIQIAVRLPNETVAFIDQLIADGNATSRADVVARALKREQRRILASRDAAIIALHSNDDDFDQLAEFAAHLAVDED